MTAKKRREWERHARVNSLLLNRWTPPAQEESDTAPDLIEEIQAWRAWNAVVVGRSCREIAVPAELDIARAYATEDEPPPLTAPSYRIERRQFPVVELRSLNSTPWPTDGWLEAGCRYQHKTAVGLLRRRDARTPDENCQCGVHAAKSLEQLAMLDYLRGSPFSPAIRVHGLVGLAGKVIEGTQGYKAARARVIEVHIDDRDWTDEFAWGIRDAYRVPVRRVDRSSMTYFGSGYHRLAAAAMVNPVIYANMAKAQKDFSDVMLALATSMKPALDALGKSIAEGKLTLTKDEAAKMGCLPKDLNVQDGDTVEINYTITED